MGELIFFYFLFCNGRLIIISENEHIGAGRNMYSMIGIYSAYDLPVNGYFPKCNAKCICVCVFFPLQGSMSCFPNLLLFLIPWQAIGHNLFCLCFDVVFFFLSGNRRWIGVQTQARRHHKIFNQKQVYAAQGTSVQSHRLRLTCSRLVK